MQDRLKMTFKCIHRENPQPVLSPTKSGLKRGGIIVIDLKKIVELNADHDIFGHGEKNWPTS